MKLIKNVIRIFLLLVVIFAGIVVRNGYQLYREAIETVPLEEKVAEIKSHTNYTSLEEMPSLYLTAVVGAEDHRFFSHNGIDIVSIGRAFWNNLLTMSLAEGGSTITQQLAKNSYFTQERKLTRKIAEVFMAHAYEEAYSKEEILEFYLNTSYFGEGCYSVKEATRVYFEKEPLEMNDYECILLAGIPNAPSVYAPTVNPDLAIQRARQVVNKLINLQMITQEEGERILQEGGISLEEP